MKGWSCSQHFNDVIIMSWVRSHNELVDGAVDMVALRQTQEMSEL